MSTSVERHTVSRTAFESASASGSRAGTALAGTALAGIAAVTVGPGAICANDLCGVPKTPIMNICTPQAAAHFCPVIRIVLLLRHNFLRALVTADDFDRGYR